MKTSLKFVKESFTYIHTKNCKDSLTLVPAKSWILQTAKISCMQSKIIVSLRQNTYNIVASACLLGFLCYFPESHKCCQTPQVFSLHYVVSTIQAPGEPPCLCSLLPPNIFWLTSFLSKFNWHKLWLHVWRCILENYLEGVAWQQIAPLAFLLDLIILQIPYSSYATHHYL